MKYKIDTFNVALYMIHLTLFASLLHMRTLSWLFAFLFSLFLALSPVATCASVHMHTHTWYTQQDRDSINKPILQELSHNSNVYNTSSAQKRFCPLPQLLFLSLSHKIVYCLTVQSFTFPWFLFFRLLRYHPDVKNTLRLLSFHKWYLLFVYSYSPSQLHEPKFQIDKD